MRAAEDPPSKTSVDATHGALDALTGRAVQFRPTNSSLKKDNGWRLVVDRIGTTIVLRALIHPLSKQYEPFAYNIPVVQPQQFAAERFEWVPLYADEHQQMCSRITLDQQRVGQTLRGMHLRDRLSQLQSEAGQFIVPFHPSMSGPVEMAWMTPATLAGPAVTKPVSALLQCKGRVIGALIGDQVVAVSYPKPLLRHSSVLEICPQLIPWVENSHSRVDGRVLDVLLAFSKTN